MDLLSDLLAYRRLLIETAIALWRRAGSPSPNRSPNDFEDSFRLEVFSIENREAAIPIRRVVTQGVSRLSDALYERDEIADAAHLIDLTIAAVSEDRPIPDRMPKTILALLAAMGGNLRIGESIRTQSIYSNAPAEFTMKIRTRIERLIETTTDDEYGDATKPLWQSVIEVGASLPPEEWNRVPVDLASNLDHYLYEAPGQHE